ncbi:DUF4349 domain-containing protein [Microbacterium sp. NPDC057407]|uniref:DUF4349 domain-containing protein n=1 Tax=Microbacterium sp. NPDC057407 TaxID=3346120 RepID=UPI0036706C2C
MSTQHPTGAPPDLPELSAQRIEEIEKALFADISRERESRRERRSRRGRLWLAGGAAAAIVAVAAVIAPSVVPLVSPGAGGGQYAVDPGVEPGGAPDAPAESGGDIGDSAENGPSDGDESSTGGGQTLTDTGESGREIITTASATVVVDDVEAAARAIGNAAVARDGYIEAMSIGTTSDMPVEGDGGVGYDIAPYPVPPDGAWITVRVPSDDLAALIDELSDVGDVTSSTIDRQDVTEQTVDLRARIDAAQASVDRLTGLLAEATSVADLIAAESALAERQAQLESYQQQLKMLEGQVAMSSLAVSLQPQPENVEADPAGFADGVLAGWNGLVATLNGIVIALGFLLPWLAVAGVIALIVWLVVRSVRRRGARPVTDAAAPPSPEETDL